MSTTRRDEVGGFSAVSFTDNAGNSAGHLLIKEMLLKADVTNSAYVHGFSVQFTFHTVVFGQDRIITCTSSKITKLRLKSKREADRRDPTAHGYRTTCPHQLL
jgi:hypothetical protein